MTEFRKASSGTAHESELIVRLNTHRELSELAAKWRGRPWRNTIRMAFGGIDYDAELAKLGLGPLLDALIPPQDPSFRSPEQAQGIMRRIYTSTFQQLQERAEQNLQTRVNALKDMRARLRTGDNATLEKEERELGLALGKAHLALMKARLVNTPLSTYMGFQA